MGLTLRLLPGEFAVCQLEPHATIPPWAGSTGFCSVTRTPAELSIICASAVVPAGVKHTAGWSLLELAGPFPFDAVGILSSVLTPLADAGISTLAIATHDTDYVLVPADRLPRAQAALTAAGHRVT